MKPIAILILASILCGPVAAAQLYRWVDEKGRVEWRDTPPPPSAKKVEQRNVGASTIETSTLPYSVQVAAKNFPVTLWNAKCGSACDQAKAHLVRRGVPHVEKDAQADDNFEKLTGGTEVPVLYVGRNQIKGYAAPQYDAALDAAGYPSSAPPGSKPAAKSAAPAPKEKPAATAAAAKPAPKPAVAGSYPPVRLYTHPVCVPCGEAKALLASRGVSFSEISADTAEGLAELVKVTGSKNVPVLFVGQTMVSGFADTNFNKALDDAGFPQQ